MEVEVDVASPSVTWRPRRPPGWPLLRSQPSGKRVKKKKTSRPWNALDCLGLPWIASDCLGFALEEPRGKPLAEGGGVPEVKS